MARRTKENKFITNTILFLMLAGVISELLPKFLIIFLPVYLLGCWLSKK